MASALSSVPAWQSFDPVPLLDQMDDEEESSQDDQELEAVIDASA